MRKKIFYTGPTRAAKAEEKSLVPARHYKPNEPTKKGQRSYVLFEPLFTSVSTVNRGHPSLVSAFEPYKKYHSRFEKYPIYFVTL
jgi:hypothetical protein